MQSMLQKAGQAGACGEALRMQLCRAAPLDRPGGEGLAARLKGSRPFLQLVCTLLERVVVLWGLTDYVDGRPFI